ncbi:MAG TPA: hypothetical protein VFB27_01190 [Opitutaceae bacterium]|nr:hypothetical protein [Opitutaceae bacterium]
MRWSVFPFCLWLPVVSLVAAGNNGGSLSPLDAAQHDLQAVQAGSEEARFGDAVKPAAPAVPADAMSLHTGAATPPPSAVLTPQKPKDDKSHWLLDAVDAQKKSPGALLDDNLFVTDAASSLAETPDSAAVAAPAKAEPPPPVVSNPLTPFLNQWMTPQDYTLLARPAPTGPLPAAGAPSDPANDFARPGEGLISGGLTGALNAVSPAGPDPKANPYLAGITDFSLPPAGPVLPPVPPPGGSPAVAPISPAPAATPAPFAPSDDNEKYFPQLKNRF